MPTYDLSHNSRTWFITYDPNMVNHITPEHDWSHSTRTLLVTYDPNMIALITPKHDWSHNTQTLLITRPLGITAQRYGFKYRLYVDDTQLYISVDPDNVLNFSSSLNNLEHSIRTLLSLNNNKTNIIHLTSPHCVKNLKPPALQIGISLIAPNGSVKIYGLFLTNVWTCHISMPSCLLPP